MNAPSPARAASGTDHPAAHWIRWASWAVLVICFFLPFCGGCMAIEVPCRDLVRGRMPFIRAGLPFLYPLLLLGLHAAVRAIRRERARAWAIRVVYGAACVGLTAFILALTRELYRGPSEDLARLSAMDAALVCLWAVLAFGLEQRRAVDQLALTGFGFSAWSLMWLLVEVGWGCTDRFVGAWLSLGAGLVATATYADDFMRWRRTRPVTPVASDE